MRTTVNLPEDVYNAARSVARVEGISLGEALAKLVRQGLRPQGAIRTEGAFPTFDVPPDAEAITLEETLALEDEL